MGHYILGLSKIFVVFVRAKKNKRDFSLTMKHTQELL